MSFLIFAAALLLEKAVRKVFRVPKRKALSICE